jgi:hypothetical protein
MRSAALEIVCTATVAISMVAAVSLIYIAWVTP